MKTLEQFKDFYFIEILPHLSEFEKKRKSVLNSIVLLNIPLWIIAGAIVFFIYGKGFSDNVYIFIFAGAAGISSLSYIFFKKKYVCDFKEIVIKKIVTFFDKGLRYTKYGCVNSAEYKNSMIFLKDYDKYYGEDHVLGIIGVTHIEFCELHTEYVTEDSKGNKTDHTIFKGLFFTADFNKHFHGLTLVLPDTAEKLMGGIGRFMQSKNPSRPDLVKLEDPDFEKHFVVYSDNQIEARYILSTSLMRRILDYKLKSKKKIQMSFNRSKLYVAVEYSKNMLEPPLFQSLLNFNLFKEYFDDLNLAVSIVEELNLNTRIWTKQ